MVETGVFEQKIVNTGLGPAIVSTFNLSVDHIDVDGFRNAIALLESGANTRRWEFNDLKEGAVIQPGEEILLVRKSLLDEFTEEEFLHYNASFNKIVVHICYCSMYGECRSINQGGSLPVCKSI